MKKRLLGIHVLVKVINEKKIRQRSSKNQYNIIRPKPMDFTLLG